MKRYAKGFLNPEPGEEEQLAVMLEQCEATLFGGLRQQLQAGAFIGAQLARIRDKELYLAAGCRTFEAYCRQYLQMARAQVRRFLDVHEVVETIRGANMELPLTEAQALMLARIPKPRLPSFWRTVLELCLREEMALSDAVVRRAIRFEIASKKLASPSESVAQEEAKKSRKGVQVTLEC